MSQNANNGFRRVALSKARDGKVIKALVKERAKVIQAKVLTKGKQKEKDIGAVTNLIGNNPRMINIIGISVQYQRSYPGGSAGKGYGGSSSSSHGGYHSKGRSERPREEAVEWHGAMYTKYTYSDGRVQWMAW